MGPVTTQLALVTTDITNISTAITNVDAMGAQTAINQAISDLEIAQNLLTLYQQKLQEQPVPIDN